MSARSPPTLLSHPHLPISPPLPSSWLSCPTLLPSPPKGEISWQLYPGEVQRLPAHVHETCWPLAPTGWTGTEWFTPTAPCMHTGMWHIQGEWQVLLCSFCVVSLLFVLSEVPLQEGFFKFLMLGLLKSKIIKLYIEIEIFDFVVTCTCERAENVITKQTWTSGA